MLTLLNKLLDIMEQIFSETPKKLKFENNVLHLKPYVHMWITSS